MNWANAITLTRVALVPLLIYELWQHNITISLILFSIIMIGDIIDGYVARKLKQVTKLGTVLDSLTDRIVMVPTFIVLMLRYNLDVMLAMLVLTRDFIYIIGIGILLFIKDKQKYIVQPLSLGKLTTLMLTVTAIATLLDFYKSHFIYVTIAISVMSATLYIIRAVKNYKRIKPS